MKERSVVLESAVQCAVNSLWFIQKNTEDGWLSEKCQDVIDVLFLYFDDIMPSPRNDRSENANTQSIS